MNDTIIIRGAKEHNLKNIDLAIPKNKLVVITGLSGSGKSSLAFDTIYAEGQRRYVESLSSYARQFLEQLQKPDVEHIEGLAPAIAIEQRSAGGSLRSTVATQTEIYDYLRLLFARIGRPHCPQCAKPITRQTASEIIEQVTRLPEGTKIHILAPVIRGKKGEYDALFKRLLKEGFSRIRVDGKIYELSEEIKLARYKIHNIEIIVDRIKISSAYKKRIADSIETSLKYSVGMVIVYDEDKNKDLFFNSKLSCLDCELSLGEFEPRMFSFNSPYGACPACNGLGTKLEFDLDLIIPDHNKTLNQGAIEIWRKGSKGYVMYYRALLREFSREAGFSLDLPFKKLPEKIKKMIIHGSNNIHVWGKPFEGLINHMTRIFKNTQSEYMRDELTKYMSKLVCPQCNGARLKKESLAVLINNKNIWNVVQLNIAEAYAYFNDLKLTDYEEKIAHNITKEIKKRLKFCLDVGLEYLSLDRLSFSLAGGEAQRIRLATQLGSSLSGVIYILDEPTIGLHSRDDTRLIATLKNLRDLGNTVIVVEHDEQVIKQSDWLIDLGPGAGINGGKIIYNDVTKNIYQAQTLTARYLNGQELIELPRQRREYKHNPRLIVQGAKEHNLKNITVEFPLETFICVTGVSGSGKSTLVEDILCKTLRKNLYGSTEKPGSHLSVIGQENIDKIIVVDQSPIGRTPRSNPATYTGVFTYIRDIFSSLPEAKERGYKVSRFSFNVAGGRCEACCGDGTKKIEMHFLPDIYVPCQVCQGKRFNEQTLAIKFKGNNIAQVLAMNVEQAYDLFENFPRIRGILQTLKDVGLGYIGLGQSATTLSGGEAQRIKLAEQLRKKATGKTLYVLDEPTTGLHFDDVKKLLNVLQRLVDKKNTVLIIEHNLDVIKCADYIVDLGPEGGDNGGNIVACGRPEKIVKCPASYTGKFLAQKLGNQQ
jgi:excinuclease ABC subunit A